MRMMTKLEAVTTLISEARSERLKVDGLKRIRRACASLGLDDAEIIEVEKDLEYRNGDGQIIKFIQDKLDAKK